MRLHRANQTSHKPDTQTRSVNDLVTELRPVWDNAKRRMLIVDLSLLDFGDGRPATFERLRRLSDAWARVRMGNPATRDFDALRAAPPRSRFVCVCQGPHTLTAQRGERLLGSRVGHVRVDQPAAGASRSQLEIARSRAAALQHRAHAGIVDRRPRRDHPMARSCARGSR